jgi:hypothetical protein
MPPGTWKQTERDVALLFASDAIRNVLSGKNNVSDSGGRRAGDAIIPSLNKLDIPYLIEVKFRKSNSTIKRALQTYKDSISNGSKENFVHVERLKGTKKVYALCVSEKWAKKICEFFVNELKKEAENQNGQS